MRVLLSLVVDPLWPTVTRSPARWSALLGAAFALSGCASEPETPRAGTGGDEGRGVPATERERDQPAADPADGDSPSGAHLSAGGDALDGDEEDDERIGASGATSAPDALFPPGTRSVRLVRSITVRAAPNTDAERLGTVAQDIRVAWRGVADGEGCEGRWIEIAPRGWICERYIEPSERPPWGVEMPRLSYGELVPGVYGKVIAEDARTVRQTDDGLSASRLLTGSVMVRQYAQESLPSLPAPPSQRPAESAAGDTPAAGDERASADRDVDDQASADTDEAKQPARVATAKPSAHSASDPDAPLMATGPAIDYWLIDKRTDEYLPSDTIREFEPSDFHGVRLGDETGRSLPLGFPLSRRRSRDRVPVYSSADGDRVVRRLTARVPVSILEIARDADGDPRAYRIGAGEWVRAREMRLAATHAPPASLSPHERWFDIDLDQQVLVAYEGTLPVYATLVSTGARKNPTDTGVFRIWIKFAERDMKDLANESPYSVATVPWTQFFANDLALHTAYWHDNFGTPLSHGCINLAPRDARFLYFWSDPQVPPGWSMANSDQQYPGSVVRIRSRQDPDPSPQQPTQNGTAQVTTSRAHNPA